MNQALLRCSEQRLTLRFAINLIQRPRSGSELLRQALGWPDVASRCTPQIGGQILTPSLLDQADRHALAPLNRSS